MRSDESAGQYIVSLNRRAKNSPMLRLNIPSSKPDRTNELKISAVTLR